VSETEAAPHIAFDASSGMRKSSSIVFLLDVDNTLLDNDRLKADVDVSLRQIVEDQSADRFWQVYEDVRARNGYVDYPLTLDLFVPMLDDPSVRDRARGVLADIKFQAYVFPGALDAISHLARLGTPVILSDGDSIFQARKIKESGLEAAVNGQVLITVHKELELDAVFERFPAVHYVMIDDRSGILAAMEATCPTTFTTVFVAQGRYARDRQLGLAPDWTINHIAEIQNMTLDQFTK
jgi:FMN phosphatase YigB (HAD superfamily)